MESASVNNKLTEESTNAKRKSTSTSDVSVTASVLLFDIEGTTTSISFVKVLIVLLLPYCSAGNPIFKYVNF